MTAADDISSHGILSGRYNTKSSVRVVFVTHILMYISIFYPLQDINEYLSERKSSNKTTLYWYHRQFIECATARYTTGNMGKERHLALADMYSAEDGVRRTITLSKRRGKCIENADRQVSVGTDAKLRIFVQRKMWSYSIFHKTCIRL